MEIISMNISFLLLFLSPSFLRGDFFSWDNNPKRFVPFFYGPIQVSVIYFNNFLFDQDYDKILMVIICL